MGTVLKTLGWLVFALITFGLVSVFLQLASDTVRFRTLLAIAAPVFMFKTYCLWTAWRQ